jgi:hypothetical protein
MSFDEALSFPLFVGFVRLFDLGLGLAYMWQEY